MLEDEKKKKPKIAESAMASHGAARAGGRRRGRGPAGSVSAPRGADRPLRPRPLCRRPVTPAPPLSSMQTRVRMAHTGMESARAALGHQETYFLKSGGMNVVAPHLHYMLCAAWVYPPQPRATVHPARAARLAAPWETAQGATSSCPVVVRRPSGATTAPLAAIFRLIASPAPSGVVV